MFGESRPGEVILDFDPAERANDAGLVFIGKVHSPWKTRKQCPRNLVTARETGKGATIEFFKEYRQGLKGLETGGWLVAIYWMNHSRRDIILQSPHHIEGNCGVFALRSPVRPNPIAMGTVKILAIDHPTGMVEIDAIDCLDGTPIIDVKPWMSGIEGVPCEK